MILPVTWDDLQRIKRAKEPWGYYYNIRLGFVASTAKGCISSVKITGLDNSRGQTEEKVFISLEDCKTWLLRNEVHHEM